jgi:hypothetical protein
MKKLCVQYMYYITVLEATSRTASVTGELQSQVPVTWLSLHFWWKMTMYVTESHHIVLIKFSLLNRTTLTFVLKLSPLQVAKFDVCTQYTSVMFLNINNKRHLSVHPKEYISFYVFFFFFFSCINTVFFSLIELFVLQNNCIPQDIDTSCRYDNDPRWFPQAMYVTESHHIVLIKFSVLNRTTLTFVLKLSPLQVAKFNVCTQY